MKILHTVEFYSPSVGGAQEVVKRISEQLAGRGHSVTVATTKLPRPAGQIAGVDIESFDVSGNAVRGVRGEADRYRDFLLDGDFDVMMNYAALQWATDLVFPLLDRIRYAKVLVPCGFSELYNPQYRDYFRELPAALGRYDGLILHGDSYRDADYMRRHNVGRTAVIPNGASEAEFRDPDRSFRRRHGIAEDALLLLTVGSHTGMKGHGLAIDAFRQARIGPAVLVLIGNTLGGSGCLPRCRSRAAWTNLLGMRRKRVLVFDPPRAEVVAAFHAADLFVFGSNLECSPIVLFEAMASRTAFITTACGNAEEIVRWSGGGRVVATRKNPDGSVDASAGDMARAIETLAHDPAERLRLAEAGRRAWQQRFTWENIAVQYERSYQAALEACVAHARRGA